MKVHYEELRPAQRAGGIEAATRGLVNEIGKLGVEVTRSSDLAVQPSGSYDCVHFHGIWSPRLARRFLLWQQWRIPLVMTLHGMLEPWAMQHKWFKKQLAWYTYQKRLLSRPVVLHATSEREANNLRLLGLKRPVAVIPWGINLDGLRDPSFSMSLELQKGDAEEHVSCTYRADRNRVALFVGRIYPVKGLPMLVEAWSRVRPTGWKMKIVGPDERGHIAEVRRLVEKAGLAEDFEFVGELTGEAKRTAYQEADLFVLPTHTENFGLVVAEALGAGLPVITTTGAPWRQLETHRCGWWTDITADGLTAALEQATRMSPYDLAAMGQRGRALVLERYGWDGVVGQMKAVYEWILGRGDRPSCVHLD